ncbi:hypothetical protein GCM10022404_13750 [Celeribacter arenosi]|uniref:Uncharacterized protein n=1 Tax=Celeribacter arenosi TaxID=792649 RepID=A0ABP7K3Z3_9RHOB
MDIIHTYGDSNEFQKCIAIIIDDSAVGGLWHVLFDTAGWRGRHRDSYKNVRSRACRACERVTFTIGGAKPVPARCTARGARRQEGL